MLQSPRTLGVMFALVLVLATSACGGSGKHTSRQPTTTTLANRKTRALTIGPVDIESAGPPVQLSKKQKQSLLAAAQQYVNAAVYAPLNTGTVGAGYASMFDPSVRTAATSTDLAALAESGLGKAHSYAAAAAPISLSGLADASGALDYLATDFTLNENVNATGGRFKVARAVELTFAPSGNQWLVTAYRVRAKRTSVVGTTTTTATSGTKP